MIVVGRATANPTIYRAGLALQIIFKNWSRFRVAILAGALATVGAIEPETHKTLMWIGMVLWFVTAQLWLKKSNLVFKGKHSSQELSI